MKGEIYVIFNSVNNKPYIGITIQGYLKRLRNIRNVQSVESITLYIEQ